MTMNPSHSESITLTSSEPWPFLIRKHSCMDSDPDGLNDEEKVA